jgi:RNA polymerase sigma factor (sigma-70 family)
MVYGLCRVLLKDMDEAEDAAQQVFLSAHRNMLAGTEPREPAAWLATIARNECHSRIRANMATPLTLVADERDAVAADVEHVASERAEIEALCAALAELPRHQRQAIVLREFYGLSYDEVRAALGVTDGAVESLLFRARKRLQAELNPARVASGAVALPHALRDSLAWAVPGFASGSSGGGLAKLASLPLLAKVAGAAATLTAAGTIGYVCSCRLESTTPRSFVQPLRSSSTGQATELPSPFSSSGPHLSSRLRRWPRPRVTRRKSPERTTISPNASRQGRKAEASLPSPKTQAAIRASWTPKETAVRPALGRRPATETEPGTRARATRMTRTVRTAARTADQSPCASRSASGSGKPRSRISAWVRSTGYSTRR